MQVFMKSAAKYSDEELVDAIGNKAGMNQAIRYIYQSYFEDLSSLIIHNSGTRQDAEDTIQEVIVTFIDVVRNGRFRGESSIKTFLMSLTRNIWLNNLRKKERSSARDVIFEKQREQVEDNMLEHIAEREKKKQVLLLLDQAGEMCKKILLLFYFQELSMKEMLAHLPYDNEQVIRNKKSKCLQKLSEQLKNNPALLNSLAGIMKDK
jgi:RNA polymerase sigma factor (sigma-70 family)